MPGEPEWLRIARELASIGSVTSACANWPQLCCRKAAPSSNQRSSNCCGRRSEVAFFPREELPLSLGRTTAQQIDRMFEHREQMELATDFD
jgi:hypothetical protein